MTWLPETQLETNIIVPFQIARAEGKDIDRMQLLDDLKTDWEELKGHALDRIAKGQLDAAAQERICYQAYNYFHPFVRGFWYDQTLVKRFRHKKLASLEARIYNGSAEQTINFDAVCDLLHFTPDIAVLVLHLKSKEPLGLKTAQDCLDRLRRLYPPYLGKDGDHLYGGHFPCAVFLRDEQGAQLAAFNSASLNTFCKTTKELEEKAGQESVHTHMWASHWSYLLKPISTDHNAKSGYVARQLGDDRAALASLISVECKDGSQKITELDQGNLSRLCFADSPGDNRAPYSERYLSKARFTERYCYDRFWYLDGESTEAPSLIMNCGYAFSWLGDARNQEYFANQNDGAPVTYRHIYVPMAIIAHFQKAALLVAARRLADLSAYDKNGAPKEWETEKFQKLQDQFIAFTQTYWFDEVTPQEQGIELFQMWRRELRLQAIYDETRQEVQDIVESLNSKQATELNRSASRVTWGGLIIGLVGVTVGLLGMNTFVPSQATLAIKGAEYANMFATWAIPVLACLLGVLLVYWVCQEIKNRRKMK